MKQNYNKLENRKRNKIFENQKMKNKIQKYKSIFQKQKLKNKKSKQKQNEFEKQKTKQSL